MRIYKYVLNIVGWQPVSMPIGARVLSVGNQNGHLCMWAMVDPSKETELRGFFIIGTGNRITRDLGQFVGTVQIDQFVWHVFEG